MWGLLFQDSNRMAVHYSIGLWGLFGCFVKRSEAKRSDGVPVFMCGVPVGQLVGREGGGREGELVSSFVRSSVKMVVSDVACVRVRDW